MCALELVFEHPPKQQNDLRPSFWILRTNPFIDGFFVVHYLEDTFCSRGAGQILVFHTRQIQPKHTAVHDTIVFELLKRPFLCFAGELIAPACKYAVDKATGDGLVFAVQRFDHILQARATPFCGILRIAI